MHRSLPRRTLALSGNREWSHRVVSGWIGAIPQAEILWIGDRTPDGFDIPLLARRQQLLGDEYSMVVIDAWAGFDPEQFGAASGTLRGGGVLVLLLPPDNEWLSYADPAKERIAHWPHTPATLHNHFIARCLRILRSSTAVEWFDPTATLPVHLGMNNVHSTPRPFRSSDQQRAITALHHLVNDEHHHPLVLLADRGRGKSAALGMAARELIEQGVQRIIVTAPHRNAVQSLFVHAAPFAPEGAPARSRAGGDSFALQVSAPNSEALRFIPPDELLRNPQPCELLLVDEAAAIPAPLLEQLLHHYPRIAFATTVHGYEGTGRGFALRFFKVLDRLTPGWQLMEMREPIRWCDNDPLEQLASDLLLLAAEPLSVDELSTADHSPCHYQRIDGRQLIVDDRLLQHVHGLLVLAHYRTSPLDLRLLLDSPDVTLHLLKHHLAVIAVAVTLREGGFDEKLSHDIYMGDRRPRGHLAAQALAFYCGVEEAPQLAGERIMRIAVHPALQHRGYGSMLTGMISDHARSQGCDYLAASYGATVELMRFWRHNALLPVRIGMSREASSGYHSALVMTPFTPDGHKVYVEARNRFLAYLPLQRMEALSDLEPALINEMMDSAIPPHNDTLGSDELRELVSFAYGKRGYESCIGAIHKLATLLASLPDASAALGEREKGLLLSRVIQHKSWQSVVEQFSLQGEADALQTLRGATQTVLAALFPEHAKKGSSR